MSTDTAPKHGWTEVPSDLDGATLSDRQVGPAHSRAFLFGPVAGLYMLVTESTYADELDVPESDDRHGTYGVESQTEYMVCTDPDDPGGTEITADVEYDWQVGGGHALLYHSPDAADRAAREQSARGGVWTVEGWNPAPDLLRAAGRKVPA